MVLIMGSVDIRQKGCFTRFMVNKQTIGYFANAPRNILLRGTGKLQPRQVMFAVTDRCNSKCDSCQIWSSHPKLNLLTPEEIYRIFSQPFFSKVQFIINSGGEPSTRKDLKELILAEHESLPKANLQVSTNGLMPDVIIELVKFCKDKGFCIEVGTSLNGVGEAHDKSRGRPGNFHNVDYLIKSLRQLGVPVAVGFTLTEDTIDNLPELRRYLGEAFQIEPLVQWYNEAPFYNNVGNKQGNSQRILEVLNSLTPNPTYELWKQYERIGEKRFPCYTLNTFFALKCNGAVVPCLRYWDLEVGNLRDTPAISVWRSQEANRVRQNIWRCDGCLNSWANEWSFCATMYPFLQYFLEHPRLLTRRLFGNLWQ